MTQRRTVVLLGIVAASALGVFAAGGSEPGAIPPAAVLASLIGFALLPVSLRDWEVALAVLLGWFVIEDLVRKLAGNDLRVYFVKDALYALLLVSLFARADVWAVWRKATGRAALPLYGLIAWCLVMSVPSGLIDWRVPLIGLRLNFLYAPLVVVGAIIGADERALSRWRFRIVALGAAAAGVGIVQAVVGPDFLAPVVETPGLRLDLFRGVEEFFFRPTGTFVDAGRFATFAMVTLAVAVATYASASKYRLAIGALVFTIALAVWMSGGRTGVVVAAALALLGLAAGPLLSRRVSGWRSLQLAGVAVIVLVVLAQVFPTSFQNRLAFYRDTLDPRSSTSEWAIRWQRHGSAAVEGVTHGGLIGHGTGRHSLGRQYLYGTGTDGGDERITTRLVESGYGEVAVEIGAIGLVLWFVWSVAWVRRLWNMVKRSRSSPAAVFSLVVLGWIVFFLFVGHFAGLANFQNYVANAYFWLLSGVIFSTPAASRAQDRMTASVDA